MTPICDGLPIGHRRAQRRRRVPFMACYLIAQINIHDERGYAKYLEGTAAVLDRFSGRVIAADEPVTPLEGEWPFGRTVLIEFPSKIALDHWYRAPRGALEPCGGERTPLLVCRSGPGEAEGSLNWGTPGRVVSSPDKAGTWQYCQMVRVRRAGPEGVTKVNQRQNASQVHTTSSNLADVGWVAARTHRTAGLLGGELSDWLISPVGRPW